MLVNLNILNKKSNVPRGAVSFGFDYYLLYIDHLSM